MIGRPQLNPKLLSSFPKNSTLPRPFSFPIRFSSQKLPLSHQTLFLSSPIDLSLLCHYLCLQTTGKWQFPVVIRLGTATPMPEKVIDVKNHQIWARYPLNPMGARFHQFLNVVEAHPKIVYKRSLGSHLETGREHPKNDSEIQQKNPRKPTRIRKSFVLCFVLLRVEQGKVV
ncbi:hypothetical protein H5410_064900 [Solanum commersonii]|uniref:Uncharacterized protein n=1 Tax=Solanum commersonii TaxID=4109 RepID=A0A9J5VYP7_SOLCO|nr:hypothetical protein H5410_064900 [Solanum commersonii]